MTRTGARRAGSALATAALATATLLVTGPTTAVAASAPTTSAPSAVATSGSPQAVPSDDQPQGKLLLMLDASGSMKESDPSGTSKMVAAKKALSAVVRGLPGDAQVGLRVYGATQPGGKPTPKACRDTQLVHPIDRLDRPGLLRDIRGFRAKGETPIAYSLKQAAKDLGDSGKRSIVLVSDGEESCVPNPCPVVKKLVGAGVDLQINTVGFGVEEKARKQLQCIADAGHGSYYDAKDADELTASLTKLSHRALRPFTVSGKPVKATSRVGQAPTITPGRYVDHYTVSDHPRYLRLRRTPGSVVHLSLVARPQAAGRSSTDTESWDVELRTPDGTSCDIEHEGDIEFFRQGSSQTVSASANNHGAAEPDATTDDPCATSKVIIAQVAHDDGAHQKIPVQLVYVEEPPVTDLDSLPEGLDPEKVQPFTAHTSGKATRVVGGGGFSDAPLLAPGTYTDTILPGEQVYYRVKLDFGQSAAFTADIAKTGARPHFTTTDYNRFGVDVWTPALYEITSASNVDNMDSLSRTSPWLTLGEFVPEVRYRNKESIGNGYNYPALRQVSLPGSYYFAIGRAPTDEPGLDVPITVRLHVQVKGKPHGQPSYAVASPAASPPPSATGTSSAGPSPTASQQAPQASATPAGHAQAAGPQDSSRDDSSPLRWIVGGGLIGLAAVAALAWAVLRRRGQGAGSQW